jgi:conjugative transfer signal peptidase TraF
MFKNKLNFMKNPISIGGFYKKYLRKQRKFHDGFLYTHLISGLIILLITLAFKISKLQLNVSTSMPIGFYRTIQSSTLNHDHIVAACLPNHIGNEALQRGYLSKGKCANGAIPVIKQVIAIPGDDVILTIDGITVNGHFYLAPHRSVDHNNLPIKQFVTMGQYSNTTGYWLYGVHAPLDSWDSRYFGAVAQQHIINIVRPVLVF